MLSGTQFIKQSVSLHLFFARIMKEHAIFMKLGFTPKNSTFAEQADDFNVKFEALLKEVVDLSKGVVSPDVLKSGEIVTPYTLNAEKATQYFTGVKIDTKITVEEAILNGHISVEPNPTLESKLGMVNKKAIELISGLIQLKKMVLSDVLSCKITTSNYPMMLEHITEEAELYLHMVKKLQNQEEIDSEKQSLNQIIFWNEIMAEHSKFIRGLLDPSENELIKLANKFANEFDKLEEESKAAISTPRKIDKVTRDSLKCTKEIQDFKTQGTQGILTCKIKSIIIPLLSDHVLREANHYLRLLKKYNRIEQ
ncbi:MAG TPA: hypothetical protein DCP90_02850 [Clostridiales bacterium]|nr:MAG: hypothetical protein A2Y22_00095 [Clostridiales bacterium GWD2_32_59]HAN09532.1 hypothetical protein [Clostridiales bacterium]